MLRSMRVGFWERVLRGPAVYDLWTTGSIRFRDDRFHQTLFVNNPAGTYVRDSHCSSRFLLV